MSKVKQVEFGGVTVNISHALAKDQKKLYYMVYPFVDRLYKEVDDVPEIGTKELANVLGFIGAEIMEKIERLALSRSFIHGSDGSRAVNESDFAGDMDAYHSLICEAISENLSSFFTRLADERRDRISKLPPKKAAQ